MDVCLTPALPSDEAAILEMNEGVFDFLDYLPNCLAHWLNEDGDKRLNLVLREDNETGAIVGFISYSINRGGSSVTAHALRIKKSLRGLGLGMRFLLLCQDFLVKRNPKFLVLEVKYTANFPLRVLEAPSAGRVVAKKAAEIFVPIANRDIKKVPYHLDDFNRISMMCTDVQVLLADEDTANGNATTASLLSLPYVVSAGHCFSVDILAETPEAAKAHLLRQVQVVSELVSDDTILAMKIFCNSDLGPEVMGFAVDRLGFVAGYENESYGLHTNQAYLFEKELKKTF